MFRIRIKNESLWRRLRDVPVLSKLVRVDMQSITTMQDATTIDLAFSDIDLLSGVSKQTNKERFASVDAVSLRLIRQRSLSRIHDVGVSSGITSLELRRQLRDAGFDGEMAISDKFARFWTNKRLLSTDVYDADRGLVCTYLGPVTGDSEDSWKFFVSRILYRRAASRSFAENDKQGFLLLHPDVLKSIEAGELTFIDFDVFGSERQDTFDFVRCMNLLNCGYFPTDDISSGIRSLYLSLVDGGVLQIGRTHLDGGNHVSFYEKSGGRFNLLESMGDGSEVHQFVAEFSASNSRKSAR